MGIKPNIIISTYYLIDAALWSHSDFWIFPTGRLAWAGLFKNGVPHGASWRGVEGGGFLYGNVGPKGYFEGHKNAYIYPDMSTALFGDFSQNKMVEAVPVTIKEVYVEKCNAILRLRFTKKPQNPITYQRWFSTQTSVGMCRTVYFNSILKNR